MTVATPTKKVAIEMQNCTPHPKETPLIAPTETEHSKPIHANHEKYVRVILFKIAVKYVLFKMMRKVQDKVF